MAKGGKADSSILMRLFVCAARVGMTLALCLLAALSYAWEPVSGNAQGPVFMKTADTTTSTEPRMLTSGAVISDTVPAGETRVYALNMSAGQRALLEIVKGDLKLKVSVCAGPEHACMELGGRRYGKLSLSFSAEISALYKIEVHSTETGGAARGYELRLVEVGGASARHQLADDAVRIEAEAESLRNRQDLSSQLVAASKYDEALRLWESAGEFGRAADTLCDMGDVYFALSQYPQSLARYTKALAHSERSGDRLRRLAALNGLGYVNIYLSENRKALSHANEMLNAIEQVDSVERDSADYKRAKAQALNIMGEVHYSSGELRQSIEKFDLALPLWTDAGERSGQALALLNLGYSYSDLGNPQAAADYFQRSLALWQSINEARGTALAQTALGGTYSTLGEGQLALNLHKQAVEHFRAIGNKQGEAAARNGVAGAYQDLNEYQDAFDNYFEALRLYEAIGNRHFTALNKFLVGRVLYRRGETERALTYYRESLYLSRDLGERVVEAHALKGLATIYFSRGDAAQALTQFEAALNIYRQVGNRRSEGYALNDIGHIYASSGNVSQALAKYAEALPIMRQISDRRGQALTLFNTAKAELGRGNLTTALSLTEESIDISESLRTKIRNSQLRTSYFASVYQQYELYIHLLMRLHAQQPDKGFAAAALAASERARARSLLDSLFEDKIEPGKGLSTDLLPKEQELLRRLDEKAEYQTRLLSRKHTDEEAEQVAQELRALTIEYQDVRSKLREQSPRLATLTQPGRLRAEDIQGIIKDDDTLLLEFALGEERSYLWIVSRHAIASYELPGRSTIEELSHRTYELLTARQLRVAQSLPVDEATMKESDAEYWRQSAALSTMLLGPASGLLGSKRLLIVSDGFLKYIPFEALPVPNQSPVGTSAEGLELLFFNHEIVGLPSALTLAAIRDERPTADTVTKTVVVIADPVFERDDPRVVASGSESVARAKEEGDALYLAGALRDFTGQDGQPLIARLPSTLREAKAIMAVTPPDEGTTVIGFAATKERIVSDELRVYRIVHFATHGLLNNESPGLSGIILSLVDEQGKSRAGFLRLHDIYNMNLSADLVVLSACRTGLGRNVQGEGVVGLTSGFMYAGAKSVIASLWKVDDDATAELMSHFYAAMLKDGLPPAAALKTAKREMWKQGRWRAPFYWAAFTLQGEYKADLRAARRTNLIRVLLIGAVLLVLGGICIYVIAARYRRGAQRRLPMPAPP
jgi:CHAT domain-containing protein/predicted negative regulator of RcsB-dependent stress response